MSRIPGRRPVATLTTEGEDMFKRILLPTDGSAVSRKAVKQGVDVAKATGAKVVGFSHRRTTAR
jgi:nucleotide-binding universal stress UspA family protein